jgi:hypothetical protein
MENGFNQQKNQFPLTAIKAIRPPRASLGGVHEVNETEEGCVPLHKVWYF